MRRSALVRRLASLEGFTSASPSLEQVGTPPENAADLLTTALARGDLVDRSVLDLGCGTGMLALGAALLGAASVRGVDIDERAVETARRNARESSLQITFEVGRPESETTKVDTVLMNPPFGAQQRHADRPFWEAAFRLAGRRIHAFALAPSRSFIARSAVAHAATVEATHPVPWDLPRTFPHHRKRSVEIDVDRWVLTPHHPP